MALIIMFSVSKLTVPGMMQMKQTNELGRKSFLSVISRTLITL